MTLICLVTNSNDGMVNCLVTLDDHTKTVLLKWKTMALAMEALDPEAFYNLDMGLFAANLSMTWARPSWIDENTEVGDAAASDVSSLDPGTWLEITGAPVIEADDEVDVELKVAAVSEKGVTFEAMPKHGDSGDLFMTPELEWKTIEEGDSE